MAIISVETVQNLVASQQVISLQRNWLYLNSRQRWLMLPRFVQRSILIEHQHEYSTLYQHPYDQQQLKTAYRTVDWKTTKQSLSRDNGWSLLTGLLFHMRGHLHCSWPVQVWCESTTTDMHSSSWRHSWMAVGLGKKVHNGTQSGQEGHIEIVQLFLMLFVRRLLFQHEVCFIFIKKINSSYNPRT